MWPISLPRWRSFVTLLPSTVPCWSIVAHLVPAQRLSWSVKSTSLTQSRSFVAHFSDSLIHYLLDLGQHLFNPGQVPFDLLFICLMQFISPLLQTLTNYTSLGHHNTCLPQLNVSLCQCVLCLWSTFQHVFEMSLIQFSPSRSQDQCLVWSISRTLMIFFEV